MNTARTLLLIALAALLAAPVASAGPAYWATRAVDYNLRQADCHTSPANECSPDCPYRLPEGIACMAQQYPVEVYEDFIGDWPA